MNPIVLPKDRPRDEALGRLIREIHNLPADRVYRVEVNEVKRTRSLQQNAYLWGVCYPTILREAGEALVGWDSDDLHEYFLGEWSGWETLEGFGRKRMKPIKRSSRLSVSEFAEYVDFIHRKAADMGIYIPSPDEPVEEP